MKRTIFLVLLVEVFLACKQLDKSDFPVLSVDLSRMDSPSVFDIFERVEIIPLETTDYSLIGGSASNIAFNNNHYYILDVRTNSLFCFNEQGKFIKKIGNYGVGPEDYNYVTSFVIHDDEVELLSPLRYLFTYKLTGKFVGKVKLPNVAPNYQEIVLLNDSIRILISRTESNQDQLYVYSIRSNVIINSFFQENPGIFNFNNNWFYKHNDSVYFYKPLKNKVYKINQHGYEVAYAWDFGKFNPETTKIEKDITIEGLTEMFKTSQIKGIFNSSFQNNQYYYTRFNRIVNQDLFNPLYINVIYQKEGNKAYVFEKFKEDLFFFPVFWCDEYVLATSQIYQKKAVEPSVLDEENRNKLNTIKDSDNPFIIKYYFK